MKLIITRHGETEENVKGILQGHLPGKLTKTGIKQARKLAERLKNEKIDVIFSSDLSRASDTAKEIAKFHPESPIYFVKELRERFMGSLQGREKTEIKGWDDLSKRDELHKLACSETIEDMVSRIEKFLNKILKKYHGKNVLIVGHGGPNLGFISVLLKKPWRELSEYKPENTSVTVFEFDENKKPELKVMNCIKHLEKK